MKKLVYIIFLVLGISAWSKGQNLSNKGTDFWAGFGHAGVMEIKAWLDTPRMSLAFSAEQAARVVVTINGTSYREVYDVPANTVMRSKNLPQGFRDIPATFWDAQLYSPLDISPGGTNSEGIFNNKAVHIESNVPIVAYEILYANASAASTMLIPVDSWGYSYKVLSHDQTVTEFEKLGRFAWVFVVANYDNTRIQINPTNATRSGLPANVPIDVVLQKGQIYQAMANVPVSNIRGTNDLIGSTIKSVANSDGVCYPIAAFVGSSGGYVSCGSFTGNWPTEDQAIQQMFPVETWGRRYLTTPSSVDTDPFTHNINFFRVMPKIPGTVVRRNGVPLTGLTKGYYEFETTTADYVDADEPIQVMQIFPSQNSCNYVGKGDPEMIFISPIEQGIKKVAFQRLAFPETRNVVVDWNFLTLNIPTPGLASLKIDGLLNNYTYSYPNPNLPGYSVVIRRWNTRSNTDARAPAQCNVESDSAFNAITYGLADALSYAYNVGTYINNLSGVPYIKNQYNTADTANKQTCAGTPVELSVLIRYQPTGILWKLSDLAGSVTPAADVLIPNPVSVGTETIWGVPYYRYRLPGTYYFNKPGTYKIPVFATASVVEQCDNTERIPYEIEVRDTLHADFNILFENCKTSELIKFTGADKFRDQSDIERWEWSFTNGASTGAATGKEVSYLFNAGDNTAHLIAVDNVGCIADTTKSFKLVSKPAVPDFTVDASAFCADKDVTFKEVQPENGVKEWYWSFGDGNTANPVLDGNTTIHAYISPKTGMIAKHVVKFSATCMSDTAYKVVDIYSKPDLRISFPSGCLPEVGVIPFTTNVTTVDGQQISSYTWNFGDAAATPANPNTSVLASPSHVFVPGEYSIAFSATSSGGCISDTLLDAEFDLKPVADFKIGTLKPCENSDVSFTDNSRPGSSAITKWKWDFADGTSSTAQNVIKSYKRFGDYSVNLSVTDENGCVSENTGNATQMLKVYQQPVIDAGPPRAAEEGTVITIQATAINAAGLVFNWTPAELLTNAGILMPSYRVVKDQVFVLTAMDSEGVCSAEDEMKVSILRSVKVPNAFTPNGDGINDYWIIPNLAEYTECTVTVFNRSGQTVYQSKGYGVPWNGTMNGKGLPIGTYYYIIQLKPGGEKLTGSITILR